MKKIAVAVATLYSGVSIGQVVVTSVYKHLAGSVVTTNYNSMQINSTTNKHLVAGNGVVWSYDTCIKITANPPAYPIETKDTTGVTNSSTVVGRANVALKEGVNNDYSFYDFSTKFSIAAEDFQILGNEAYVAYNDNIDLLSFPMMYGATATSFDTATSWTFATSNTMKRTIKSTMTYDGYGSLKLNNKLTLDSVSRIKLVQVIKDTLIAPANPFFNRIKSVRTVYYYVRAGNELVAQWELDSVSSSISTQKLYKFVVADKYNAALNSVNKITANTLLRSYPNPTNGTVTIAVAHATPLIYTLYNNLGQALLSTTLSTSNATLNIANVPAGIYLLRSVDGNYQTKIVKQ